MSEIDKYDSKEIYCRRLGGIVPFKYCRTVNEKLPCPTIISCWEIKFNVEEFIKACYEEAEIEKFLFMKKSRLDRIMETLTAVDKGKK